MYSLFTRIGLAIFFLLNLTLTSAQEQHPIIFIYDASGSMWGKIGNETKMQIASGVLQSSLTGLPENQQLSLIAYGHREKDNCEDVEFLLTNSTDKSLFSEKLKGIKPLGRTPLASSALQAINFLKKEKSKATIILITDGVESCGGDLCEVVKKAKQEGIPFKLHIVGFGLKDNETLALACAAEAGDGRYFDAQDQEGLESVLWEATQNTVEEPEQNVSFTVFRNNQPIDALIRAFDKKTNAVTGAVRTYRDTGFLFLTAGKHRLEIHPLENSDLQVQVIPEFLVSANGKTHEDFSFDSGKITVLTTNNGQPLDARVRVFKSGEKKAVSSGRTYGEPETFELDPGTYDFEIEAIGLEGAAVRQWVKGKVITPRADLRLEHPFFSGTLKVGVASGGKLVDAIVKIKDLQTGETVVGRRTYTSPSSNPRVFQLLPGAYEIHIKGLKAYGDKESTFEIQLKKEETKEHFEKF